MKKFVKKILKEQGFEIRHWQPRREDFLLSREIDTVIDAGANVGQFGLELRRENFSGAIVSFEPIKDCYTALLECGQRDPKWKAFNCGLSNHTATAQINVSANPVFSSLHDTTAAAFRFDQESSTTRVEEIELHRLEDFDSKIEGKNIFLKVDTQGHERHVIEGAGSLLERVRGIQLELPISKLYQNSWSISDAFDFMRSLGFIPTFFWPVNFHKSDRVAIVEVDCIFRRFDSNID